jgi:hypothetical protein
MSRPKRKGTPIEQPWRWHASWWRIGWPSIAARRISSSWRGKTSPWRRTTRGKQSSLFGTRPARSRYYRTGRRSEAPHALFNCFETGRRSLIQSSVEALRGRDSKWMSGSAPSRNHRREAQPRAEELEKTFHALLLSASGRAFFSLDKTYHGCPVIRLP